MDERREGAPRAEHRLSAHRSANRTEEREVDGLVRRERAHGRGERGPVQDPEVLLGREVDRLDVVRGERLARGHDAAPAERRGAVEHADRRVADDCASYV